jgi:glycosyltransferase involved in cell wall biosynthesis
MNWERGDEAESLNGDGSQSQCISLDSQTRSLTASQVRPQILEAGCSQPRTGTASQVRPTFRTGSHANPTLFAEPRKLEAGMPLANGLELPDSSGKIGNQEKSSAQSCLSQSEMLMAAALRAEGHAGRRRHICIVTETYPPEINGVALTLGHLAEGLSKIGHRVSLVRPWQRAADASGPAKHRSGLNQNNGIETMLVRGMPLPGYRGLQIGWPAGRRLREFWSSDRPDVIYVATEGPLGWSAVCSARSLGIPAFSGFHTNYDIYAKHYRLGRLQKLVFNYLRLLHNRTDGTLVASGDLCVRLEQCGFKDVKVLGRGVDNQLFAPERRSGDLRRHWGVAEGELAALYVGRLAPEKNVRLAIGAYEEMKRRNAASKFILVGDGPIRGELQAEYPGLGFAGTQTGEALACHYASADIFLFPSETETFGNVTLEAMASGLAVVAYDYAAARIHIRHRETGWLVPYGDGQSFIESAAGLARERGTLDQMRRRAREYTAAVDWTKVVDRFDELLQGSAQQESLSTGGGNFEQVIEGGRL